LPLAAVELLVEFPDVPALGCFLRLLDAGPDDEKLATFSLPPLPILEIGVLDPTVLFAPWGVPFALPWVVLWLSFYWILNNMSSSHCFSALTSSLCFFS